MKKPGDPLLRLAVDLGQVIVRPFEADGEGGVEEALPRRRPRLARGRLRGQEPHLGQIGLGQMRNPSKMAV